MRIQVNLSEEIIDELDEYAQSVGVSRSALCAVMIGQGMVGYRESKKLLSQLGKDAAKTLKKK